MDLCGFLNKLSVLNFYTKCRKELKVNYDRANPLLDAWMMITEKQRPEFDVQIIKLTLPSQKGQRKSEQYVECFCAGMTEKRIKRIHLLKSGANKIDM